MMSKPKARSSSTESGATCEKNSYRKESLRIPQSESNLDIDDGASSGEHDKEQLEKVKTGDGGLVVGAIQRVLSKRSLAISNYVPEPPPDGGLQAWLQVFQAHLCNFNAMGYSSSYGLFEAYYLSPTSPMPTLTSSVWTWPGSLQLALFCFMAALTGRFFDAGFYRPLILIGFAFQLLGIFTTANCTTYVQIFLSQGVAQGIGNGFVLCPSISLVSTYFVKKRTVAISFVAAGSATGGVVFPLIAQQLLPKIGFPWTVRVMGFVMLANMAIILALGRTRLPGRKSGPWLELSAFEEAPYVLYICGMFCIFLGLYFAFSYINLYAKDVLGTSASTSLTILLLLSAMGVPGRVFPALLADAFFGPLNTLIPSVFLLAILFFVWIAVTSLKSLYAFTVVFGLVDAAVQALMMGSLTSLTKDPTKMGTRIGMALTILAFGQLAGPPIAGQLIDINNGSFLYTQIFGGVATFVGCGFLVGARVAETGWEFKKRM